MDESKKKKKHRVLPFLLLIAAVLAVWYGAATVLSNVRSLLS